MRIVIDIDDVLFFVDRALDGLLAVVASLGDDLANTVPPLPGANAPAALLVHCLGVVEFWGGAVIAGRTVERDRAAEFETRATLAVLTSRVAAAKRQLRGDLAVFDGCADVRTRPPDAFRGPAGLSTQGAALVHLYEELAQHLGHAEITRDVLRYGLGHGTDR